MFEVPTTVEIADGRYPAIVEAIEPITTSYGASRRWSFLVTHKKADGTDAVDSISVITSNHLGPKSKAYAFLSGLLGRPLKAGEKIEDPTGTRCLVDVVHNEKGFPTIGAVQQYSEPQQELPGIPR